jgi:hypothetical protein
MFHSVSLTWSVTGGQWLRCDFQKKQGSAVPKQQHLARIDVLLHEIRSTVAEIQAAEQMSDHEADVLQHEIAAIEALIARHRTRD